MESKLSFRLNACPVCLICLKCNKTYGNLCSCESITMYWSRNIEETKNFRTKTLTQEAARKRSNKFTPEFISWFWSNVSPNLEISSSQPLINICKSCLNKYDYLKAKNKKREEPAVIDLTQTSQTDKSVFEEIKEPTFISLLCFNQFCQPRKKLDGALSIPFNLDNISNFGNIEEEILSRKCPSSWGKIEIGLICYQLSSAAKADHFELNTPDTVSAFISAAKNKKVQLCVYQEKKTQKKQVLYGSSVISQELNNAESEAILKLNQIKEEIYKNLKQCTFHIQGCLIADDGRHLKLNGEMVTMWARSIIGGMMGVDINTPPSIPVFDKSKYRLPRQQLQYNTNNISEDETAGLEDQASVSVDQTHQPIISKLKTVTIHTKKKSHFKANIQVVKGMTFKDLISFAFPIAPSPNKRFIIKSSPDSNSTEYLPNQIIDMIFHDQHAAEVWVNLENINYNYKDLFGED